MKLIKAITINGAQILCVKKFANPVTFNIYYSYVAEPAKSEHVGTNNAPSHNRSHLSTGIDYWHLHIVLQSQLNIFIIKWHAIRFSHIEKLLNF